MDEAGCLGVLPSSTSNVQPVFCLAALIIPQKNLLDITHEFLTLKREFNPNYAQNLNHDLDLILYEIKGSNIRSDIKSSSRNKSRRSIGLIDKTLRILEKYECKLLARGFIKEPGGSFESNSVYTSSVQSICLDYNHFLDSVDSTGIIIADSRKKAQNNKVSHSIFTKKFKQSGDEFPRILEMPVFGHSENHAGLQISDWVVSSLLFPIMSYVYCSEYVNNIHVNPKYKVIKDNFVDRLKGLQYRYKTKDPNTGKDCYKGGITVSDGILKSRSAGIMFKIN